MKYNTFFYYDFETTGLKVRKGAEPFELAGILFTIVDGQIKELGRFPVRRMRVKHPELATEQSLKIHGVSIEEIQQGEDPRIVMEDLVKWLASHTKLDAEGKRGKVIPAGHNVTFDIDFMEYLFEEYVPEVAYETVFDYHKVCTMQLVQFHKVMKEQVIKQSRLVDVAAYYGIPHQAHTAMGDVEVGLEVLKRLWEM